MRSTVVEIGCPFCENHDDADGSTCVRVEVSGRYRPPRGYDPPEWPEFDVMSTSCGCDPVKVQAHPSFDAWVLDALRV